MQEFIKYALEIQGNYNLAYSAQRELSMREAINNNAYESYANSNPNPNFKSNQGNNQKEVADEINLVLARRNGDFLFSRASAKIGKLRVRGGAKIAEIEEFLYSSSLLNEYVI